MCKPNDHRYRPAGRGGKPAAILSLIGVIERAANEASCTARGEAGNLTKTATNAQHAFIGAEIQKNDASIPWEAITESSNHTTEEAEVHSLTSTDPGSAEGEHRRRSIDRRAKKRRRPPLNPLTKEDETQKGYKRVYVHHNYHDYSRDRPTTNPMRQPCVNVTKPRSGKPGNANGGVSSPFPAVLHNMLECAEADGYATIVSWQPHGRAFLVHDQSRFVSEVMPQYFRQTRFSSFQRQLSLYGFLRLTRKDRDHGGYYHELFLRGLPHLCDKMQRTRIKGYRVRQASSPETEPNFYEMAYVGGKLVDNEKGCPQDDGKGCSQNLPQIAAKDPSQDVASSESSIASFEVDDDDGPIPSFEPQAAIASMAFAAPDFNASSRRAFLSAPFVCLSSADYMKIEPIQTTGSTPSNLSETSLQPLQPTALNDVGADMPQDEQNDMAAFLSDVDLESENGDSVLYQQEETMQTIYSSKKPDESKHRMYLI